MRGQDVTTQTDIKAQRMLLQVLAGDLQLPLLQIKTKLEVLQKSSSSKVGLHDLSLSTESALRMLEAYLYATDLPHARQLTLEPISCGVLLEEAAHTLQPYAKQYNTELVVDGKARRTPVLAHKTSAVISLTCLAESLLKVQKTNGTSSKNQLVFGAHQYRGKVIAGIYGQFEILSSTILIAARTLGGNAHQALSSLPASSSSGILIADQLCSVTSVPLQPSKHMALRGLATNFAISSQLQLL